jgi:hypothetical protein
MIKGTFNKKISEKKPQGSARWIRLRGASDDPESFEYAIWNGLAWELSAPTADGREITLYIPDYMVAETLPANANPQSLYKAMQAA